MNKNRFKLVFSKVLKMLVPVSEMVGSCKTKSHRRIRNGALTVFKFLAGVAIVNTAWGDTSLPEGISIRSIVGNSTRVIASDLNKIHFEQLSPRAIVDFNQLNLQKDQQFNVNMQSGWSMLNRIHDLNPSFLNGQVNAAGNLYFINSNGIIIGKDAQFNVGSLYAGTLNITDQLFQDGFVNEQTFTNPFSLVGTIDLSPEARQKVENAQILVENGARINTTKNGKVMLFAPNVKVEENAIISTPEGQTILAAGERIWLRGSADPAGFLVEVDVGGTATNLGQLIAERGNVTMMGLAVNQSGTVSASTSVRANGSIRLVAQDRVNVVGVSVTGKRNGVVTLGKGSVTEVRPELNDTEETIVSQPFKTSEVLIEASMINIEGAVNVKGGNVTARADFDASPLLATRGDNPINNGTTRRIMLGESATIDVSGVNAFAPMSRNQLEVQLFSDQLKDAPILRDTDLFRSTVYVDARKGTDLFDIQPFLDLRPATVAERMTNAGNVNLSTNQELIFSQGATINVSGGSTTYDSGNIKESRLSFNGQLVPISQALPGVPYTTVADNLTRTDPRWGTSTNITVGGLSAFVPSYFEGANAGTVNLSPSIDSDRTKAVLLSGNFLANTLVSREQLINQSSPLGGQLIVSGRNLTIDSQATTLPSQFGFNNALPNANNFSSNINTDFLENGFNRIDFSKVDQITINQQLNLASHGSLIIGNPTSGTNTRLNANIIAPNSKVTFDSLATTISDNVTVSTAGRFTNDMPGVSGALTHEVAKNGGNITLGITSFGNNVTLDSSAGAAVDFLGNFQTGTPGNISFGTYDALPDNLSLRSFGFDIGGQLSIAFGDASFKRDLFVGSNLAQDDNDISIAGNFFHQGGFSKYKMQAFNVVIGNNQASDQTIYTSMQNWRINSGYKNLASGQSIGNVASPVTMPDYIRQASSLWFESPTLPDEGIVDNLGKVTLSSNTILTTDIGGKVTMRAGKQVNVLGDISAPGGQIDLSINDVNAVIDEIPNQMVFIGENAIISAQGSTISLPDSRPNLLNNKVVAAGNISINTRQASILKGAVVIKEGAILDVSSTSIENDTKTSRGIVREMLFADAGTININGAGSLLIDGTFLAQALGSGRDGSLNLLFNPIPFSGQQPFPNDSGQFFLTQQKQLSASGLDLGDALKNNALPATQEATARLKAQISVEQINQAGFANFEVKTYLDTPSSSSRLVLSDGVELNIAGNLEINSPIILVSNQGSVALTAGHITLSSPNQVINQSLLNGVASLQGNGSLSLNADQIYIDGVTTLGGVNQANLEAKYDIHGQGARSIVQLGNEATDGGLLSNDQINLTARQIYPESGGRLTFRSVGTNSQIKVSASQQDAKPVLSAGGILNLQANTIEQNGVLTAPFGTINLIGEQISLGSDSITSVSANNALIPFGVTTTSGQVFNPNQGLSRPLVESEINLIASNINLNPGSTVDLSAGGDVFAFEWIPGLGGSIDILAQPDTYALIPNFNQVFAPRDLTMVEGAAPFKLGQTIFLTGGKDLPTGEYTLLPARYALVPGAFVVQLKPNTNLLAGQSLAQADGSLLTTGYFADFSTRARDAEFSTFSVFSGALFRPAAGEILKAPSQYALTSANKFFTDPANTEGLSLYTPKDVAKLSLSASQLSLNGNVVANTSQGGRGLLVDIGSNNIRIVNNKDNNDSQSLQISTAELNQLGAQSLLLGGTRNTNEQGQVEINTVATIISIENDADNTINTPELIATARDRIEVLEGAVISTGFAERIEPTTSLLATGDGALLALSSNRNMIYSRQGATASSSRGELLIGNQSKLFAGKSAILDATKNVSFEGILNLEDQGSLTLGANRILIGQSPTNLVGLNLDNDAIASFGDLGSLTLNSYSNVDTFGELQFGDKNLNLTINAAGIVGNASVDSTTNSQVVITANQLTLKNTQSAVLTNFAQPGSNLTLNANEIKLEGKVNTSLVGTGLANTDKFNIQGYDHVTLNAEDVRTLQFGETVFNVANVDMNVGRIGGESGSIYTISSSGLLRTVQTTPLKPLANDLFAGRLTLQAQDLTVGSRVESASGIVTLIAENDLRLTSEAKVSADARTATFADVSRSMPAGLVNLAAINGDISIDQGAIVTVNAQGDANAGQVNLKATKGTLQLEGLIEGVTSGAGQGASLNVDVKTLAELSQTNAKSLGFNASREYRVRQGDISISGTGEQSLSAQQIRVTADGGNINVTGELSTNSSANGSIGLFAQTGLTIAETAKLDASSSGAGAKGGSIDLYSASGMLDLLENAEINVSGGNAGRGGVLHLRTSRSDSGSGNGVMVSQLSSNIIGAEQTVLEAFRVFNNVTTVSTGNGNSSALGFNTIANDITNFMANRNTIEAFLGKAGDPSFLLLPGIEIRSSSNLTIGTNSVDWNLFPNVTSRTSNDVGILTLRAKNDLRFNGGLSDGFSSGSRNLISTETAGLLTDHTWSYRLVAGADEQSSNVMNTIARPLVNGRAADGNLTIGNDKVIRTGTGFIDIATGGDLRLNNQGSVIYTAGRRADALPEFTLPQSNLNALYLTDGGNISIRSQGSVEGAELASGRQMVNQWLFRQGGGSQSRDTSWWVRPDEFKQGIATFGGGNISVIAGGDISNFSASAPTTARYDNFSDAINPATGNYAITGGGDLKIQANGNIVNGTFFVAKGEGNLIAGGSIEPNSGGLGTVLALQDGSFNVLANGNVYISTTFNPSLVNQSSKNTANSLDSSGINSNFNSYSNRSGVSVLSSSGNVGYGTGDDVFARNAGLYSNSNLSLFFGLNPSKIDLTSFSGDISFGRPGSLNKLVMMPSSDGQLSLLANNNIRLGNTDMSDADPNALPGINSPLNIAIINVLNSLINSHSLSLLHRDNNTPAMIISSQGDIYSDNFLVTIPKATRVIAGRDITDISFGLQNNRPGDVSLIKAGRDVNTRNIVIGGPGELLVQAGRNIDLIYPEVTTVSSTGNGGSSNPIFRKTFAEFANPALSPSGASITLQAGLGEGANVENYINQYILPTGSGPSSISNDAQRLSQYRQSTTTALTGFMRTYTGDTSIDDAQALSLFSQQNLETKTVFVNRHLTSELIASGRDFAKAGNHNRGNEAKLSLFADRNDGNILLFNSKVSTNSGGSVDLIAPGGFINVGVPGQGGDIGIITEKGGAIRGVAEGDFQVNQSKVITQFGSDIAIWSTSGTIDAGRGSKTATSIPERIVQTDAYGNTTLEVRGVAAGSGIRAQSYDPDGPNGPLLEPKKGNISLIAPVVDAGEAGIEAGDLLIVAPVVLNAANIQVQGIAAGVPIAASSSIAGVSAGLSPDAVNSATKAVTQSVAPAADNNLKKPKLPSMISVDVIGMGDEEK
jgi:filamentous hemagglutinin family protein